MCKTSVFLVFLIFITFEIFEGSVSQGRFPRAGQFPGPVSFGPLSLSPFSPGTPSTPSTFALLLIKIVVLLLIVLRRGWLLLNGVLLVFLKTAP